MSKYEQFRNESKEEIAAQGTDRGLDDLTRRWMERANALKYSYHFEWLGRPIIQYPQDIVAMQELIWTVQPDLIIETGIAHGGSLVFSASMLELNAACGGPSDGEVIGVDIEIRPHNREALEAHPMYRRITMIEGSSTAPEVIDEISEKASAKKSVLVCLDSNHSHEHVLRELEAYAPLTSIGSYCVVFDTVIERLPSDQIGDRPWGVGNNPKTALRTYLERLESEEEAADHRSNAAFEVDESIDDKLLITVAPGGYLRRIK